VAPTASGVNDPQQKWQLLLAVHKRLSAADQIGSYLVCPLVIDGPRFDQALVAFQLGKVDGQENPIALIIPS
jgi:hypothetical protein